MSLSGVNFLDLGRGTSVRKRSEDLHVDVISLADLDFDPEVGAGNDLLSASNGSEVSNG